jgi:hypothetical protein
MTLIRKFGRAALRVLIGDSPAGSGCDTNLTGGSFPCGQATL